MHIDISVTRRLGDVRIACDLVAADGLTALVGPSGVGKTSVLNMIAGLLRPDHGRIRVGDALLFDTDAAIDLPPAARRCGYVFQDARLFPHLRVADNLDYGARRRRGTGLIERADAIALLGLGHLLARWPRTLSGGEARRVAIGRALLSDPAFLLLDEPLSSLDRARREEIMQVLERLRDAVRLPMLMVSHDIAEAERLGSRIVEL
ncbi:ATP-binding cassette domain-containing protein [Sphingomonas japonica]|uniref:Molybdate transport system ATP-binding protein n=1 Tax=Sphingomonas japonica TaxID=511662 RepID=A0ABX0TX12_9SPHN|nr:ATP-binding cassette domain-containing protein [Sphingomonas japonica]NIJ22844.1 molybdate transport system ATP-binding protein [Sphingomonas japonica]